MSHIVNPAVLKKEQYSCDGLTQEIQMKEDFRWIRPDAAARRMALQKAKVPEKYSAADVYRSSHNAKAAVYASEKPTAGEVMIQRISPKTDPNLGSNEYYSSGVPGTMILRRYNNIFIPRLPPY